MERDKTWKDISDKGNYMRKKLTELSQKYDLGLKLSGISSLISYQFISKDSLKYKTFITQEMLARGYLASNLCYISTEHTFDLIDSFIENLDQIFEILKDCENGTQDIDKLLKHDCCHNGFERLN